MKEKEKIIMNSIHLLTIWKK